MLAVWCGRSCLGIYVTDAARAENAFVFLIVGSSTPCSYVESRSRGFSTMVCRDESQPGFLC